MDFTGQSNVYTTTLPQLVGKAIDTVVNYSPLTMKLLGNQVKWSGSQVQRPIKYQQNSTGMAFNGLERFNTTKQENFALMKFDPTGYEMSVVISGIEKDLNASRMDGGIDLVKRQLASDQMDMADDIAEQFYTAQTGKNFLSVVDAADDGSNVANYGGLARSTYTGIQGNYTASVGTLTLATVSGLISDCTHGTKSPDLMVTDKTTWGYVERLLEPKLSATYAANGYPQVTRTGIVAGKQALTGEAGFNAIFYRGIPLTADEKNTSGYLYAYTMDYLKFHGLASSNPKFKPITFGGNDTLDSVYTQGVPTTTGFHFSGFNSPIDQYGEVGQIILLGNLICDNPRHFGVLRGITGV